MENCQRNTHVSLWGASLPNLYGKASLGRPSYEKRIFGSPVVSLRLVKMTPRKATGRGAGKGRRASPVLQDQAAEKEAPFYPIM